MLRFLNNFFANLYDPVPEANIPQYWVRVIVIFTIYFTLAFAFFNKFGFIFVYLLGLNLVLFLLPMAVIIIRRLRAIGWPTYFVFIVFAPMPLLAFLYGNYSGVLLSLGLITILGVIPGQPKTTSK
ncbi:MAG: DUF805 domain-containing protein [Maricaulaceae bacterium]